MISTAKYEKTLGGAGLEGSEWDDVLRWKIALREKETMNNASKMLGDGMAIVNKIMPWRDLLKGCGFEAVVLSGTDEGADVWREFKYSA